MLEGLPGPYDSNAFRACPWMPGEGAEVRPDGRRTATAITTTNPATGEVERTFEAFGESEIEDRLGRAAAAFEGYRSTSLRVRAAWMNGAAEILETDLDAVAEMMTREMGK